MAASAFVLGLDLDRTGLGLVLAAQDGSVVAHLQRLHGEDATDPQDWWRAARTGIKDVLRRASLRPEQVRAIGLTGDSDGVVAVDKTGKVLAPSVLGHDPAAEPCVDQILAKVGARNFVNLAGAPCQAAAAAAKLVLLRATAKRAWHDLAHALAPKDFLRLRLTGTYATDAGDAAATQLYHPRTRAWSKQLCQLLEFDPAWFPAVAAGNAISGRVNDAAARETGIPAGTPVVTGASHAGAIAIAAGALKPGRAALELGGHGTLAIPVTDAQRDPTGRFTASCHSIHNGALLTANGIADASALDWLGATVLIAEMSQARRAGRDALDALAELAAEVPAGADGLYLLPHARGGAALLRLLPRHGHGHLVRAALEAGALSARLALAAAAELKAAPDQLVLTGPGAASTLWCQLVADALDRPLHATQAPQPAAFGVAVLAASAVGVHKTIEDACQRMVKTGAAYQPRRAAAAVYAEMAPVQAQLQRALDPAPAVPAADAQP
jgi:xylulokinase